MNYKALWGKVRLVMKEYFNWSSHNKVKVVLLDDCFDGFLKINIRKSERHPINSYLFLIQPSYLSSLIKEKVGKANWPYHLAVANVELYNYSDHYQLFIGYSFIGDKND